jgi:hypothetical protein
MWWGGVGVLGTEQLRLSEEEASTHSGVYVYIYRCEDNIKMDFQKVECEAVDYISVSQTFFKWGPLLLVRMFYGPLLSVRMFYGPPYSCPL